MVSNEETNNNHYASDKKDASTTFSQSFLSVEGEKLLLATAGSLLASCWTGLDERNPVIDWRAGVWTVMPCDSEL